MKQSDEVLVSQPIRKSDDAYYFYYNQAEVHFTIYNDVEDRIILCDYVELSDRDYDFLDYMPVKELLEMGYYFEEMSNNKSEKAKRKTIMRPKVYLSNIMKDAATSDGTPEVTIAFSIAIGYLSALTKYGIEEGDDVITAIMYQLGYVNVPEDDVDKFEKQVNETLNNLEA